MKAIFRAIPVALIALGFVAPAWAAKASSPARMIVEDNAKIFSDEAKEKAKKIVSEAVGEVAREFHIETYDKLSEADAKEAATQGDTFWNKWVEARLKGDRGIVVLINMTPPKVFVRADKAVRDLGFDAEKEKNLRDKIIDQFKKNPTASQKERQADFDAGLVSAAEYVRANLPMGSNAPPKNNATGKANGGGMGIGGWICLGIAILLGVWLIFGLIRAFSGGGGGGYGGGYGGGGGGFFSGLMGGLFGAVAGMWMYNQFFGGSTPSAYGGDNGTGSTGGDPDTGGGDFGGDTGANGDFGGGGDGGGGGGDWGGGGGGDWGGGGGGGGDF